MRYLLALLAAVLVAAPASASTPEDLARARSLYSVDADTSIHALPVAYAPQASPPPSPWGGVTLYDFNRHEFGAAVTYKLADAPDLFLVGDVELWALGSYNTETGQEYVGWAGVKAWKAGPTVTVYFGIGNMGRIADTWRPVAVLGVKVVSF